MANPVLDFSAGSGSKGYILAGIVSWTLAQQEVILDLRLPGACWVDPAAIPKGLAEPPKSVGFCCCKCVLKRFIPTGLFS